MIETVVVPPAAHSVVPRVPFDEVEAGLHVERAEGKWLVQLGFRDDKIGISKQLGIGPENQCIGARGGVDAPSQLHSEMLDRGRLRLIHQHGIESPLGNLEIVLDLDGREPQKLRVVDEAILRHTVGGQRIGKILLKIEQIPQGVAVLSDRQAANRPQTGKFTRLGNPHTLSQPVVDQSALGWSGLGFLFGGHVGLIELPSNGLEEGNLLVVGGPVDMIDPNTRLAIISVVTAHTVLGQQRLNLLLELRF